jgi:hypothetical protein
MKNNKIFTLTNCGKTSFFIATRDSCKLITSIKRIKKKFFVGRIKIDIAPPVLSGEELYDMVSQYDDIVFGFQFGKKKFLDFNVTHNCVKQSIFSELSC